MMRKRNKHVGRVQNDSTVNAANAVENLNRQGTQKKDASVSNCDLKNLSQADDDATSSRELPSAVNVTISQADDDATSNRALPSAVNVTISQADDDATSYRELPSAVNVNLAEPDDDATSNRKLPSAVNVNLSADKNQDKCVPKDLSRNKSVSVQGSPTSGASLNAGASKLAIPEDKARTICGRENDICWAVNEAHGAQLASEAVEKAMGYPIAEFEKFLRSASPIICPSVQGGPGAPLVRREIPNISLWNLWQCFEKHGNYGLEVETEEHTTSRLKFSAYFVPSLSAVQLFKDNGTQGSPTGDFHARFALLVPKPRVASSSSLPKQDVFSDSRSSSECGDTDPPIESKSSDELLFEYFEHEQPQNRKPFFEKIQELAAGTSSSRGDPSILQSARLPDLHPHSWFCIAWYPIYRIPSGKFRASFLTYHSLGHYVHSGKTLDAQAGIVSPIVGFQSYNTKGECWFQPRHLNEVTHSVLRDRLKTLEQTALFMSRAVRTNGAETLVNRHPDYEFFVSRWH